MEPYPHHVLGLYVTRDVAEQAREELLRCGLPAANLTILQPDGGGLPRASASGGDDADLALLQNGIGGTEGIDQALANVSLFAASPVLGALMALGWRASLGGLAGALVATVPSAGDGAEPGTPPRPGPVSAVLVAHAVNERQKSLARMVIAASMGDTERAQAQAQANPALTAGASGDEYKRRAPFDRRRVPDRRATAQKDLPSKLSH